MRVVALVKARVQDWIDAIGRAGLGPRTVRNVAMLLRAALAHAEQARQRQRLEEAFTSAGVDYTLEIYEGARHGFAVTGHLVYDRDASERHWERLLARLGVLHGV